jgi:hypothetical protein
MDSVPNLDGMSANELRDFWHKYHRARRKDAESLVGRRKGSTRIAALLAAYADNKATAMDCRLRADITAAQIYEKICDDIYNRLPADLRW